MRMEFSKRKSLENLDKIEGGSDMDMTKKGLYYDQKSNRHLEDDLDLEIMEVMIKEAKEMGIHIQEDNTSSEVEEKSSIFDFGKKAREEGITNISKLIFDKEDRRYGHKNDYKSNKKTLEQMELDEHVNDREYFEKHNLYNNRATHKSTQKSLKNLDKDFEKLDEYLEKLENEPLNPKEVNELLLKLGSEFDILSKARSDFKEKLNLIIEKLEDENLSSKEVDNEVIFDSDYEENVKRLGSLAQQSCITYLERKRLEAMSKTDKEFIEFMTNGFSNVQRPTRKTLVLWLYEKNKEYKEVFSKIYDDYFLSEEPETESKEYDTEDKSQNNTLNKEEINDYNSNIKNILDMFGISETENIKRDDTKEKNQNDALNRGVVNEGVDNIKPSKMPNRIVCTKKIIDDNLINKEIKPGEILELDDYDLELFDKNYSGMFEKIKMTNDDWIELATSEALECKRKIELLEKLSNKKFESNHISVIPLPKEKVNGFGYGGGLSDAYNHVQLLKRDLYKFEKVINEEYKDGIAKKDKLLQEKQQLLVEKEEKQNIRE